MDSEQENSGEELPDHEDVVDGGVGEVLRTAREAKRLELSHIAGETRIPIRHLEAIEAGQFDSLPSRTYAIGFAKTFANSVGLDPDAVAQSVREELSDGYARGHAAAGDMEPGDPAKLPSVGLAWFGGLAAILFGAGVVFFYNTYFAAGSGPSSLLAVLSEDETAQDTAPVEPAAQDIAEAAAPSVDGQVVFTALEDGVWVRFYEDGGERLFEAQMATGDRFELPLDAIEPRINTGRPDAFAITIGGLSVPKLSEQPITLGDAPISAAALLARVDEEQAPLNN